MAAEELETIPIHDKQYVSLKDAAKFLGISRHWLEDLILLEKIEAVRIESRHLIELETLQAFADSRKPKASAWDRLDEWRDK
jgi:predicted DNA-binding protein (UPF0251 family)